MRFPSRRRLSGIAAIALVAALTSPAFAGMPSFDMTDLVRMRFEAISFFLLLFLLSAAVIKLLWNHLARDFHRLPRLTYKRSLAVVSLWGLLFLLVLTMISGARELMTPGAWEKDGATYKLAYPSGSVGDRDRVRNELDAARRPRLEALRTVLWAYADAHGGEFPTDPYAPGVPDAAWETPEPSRVRYAYVPGLRRAAHPPAVIVAYEPPVFLNGCLALKTDGTIVTLPYSDARELSMKLKPPTTGPAR